MSAAYRVRYRNNEPDELIQRFEHQEETDHFAQAMELMGCTSIIKEYWQPHMQEWFRYHRTASHNDKER